MKRKKILRWLYERGHFRNPQHPTSVSKPGDLEKLSLVDEDVVSAIQSFQESDENFDRLGWKHHGRAVVADGEIGPATVDLLKLPRCGHPDFPENAEPASGSGSWPVGCHEKYSTRHAFAVYFDFSTMPRHWGNPEDPNSPFRRAWALVVLSYADMGIVFFETRNRNEANTIVTWQRGSGWIGLAVVPNQPRCGERIWAKYDNRYSPSDLINKLARLLAHEKGHNMGQGHTRGGTMNPSIISGPYDPDEWRGDPSEAKFTRWFGGEPVPIEPDGEEPEPPPEPPGDDYYFRGLTLYKGNQPVKDFLIVPKPEA